MHFNSAIVAAILAFCASGVLAAPLPQLAGEGAAANSILSGTDTAVGLGVEDAEDNIAGNIVTVKGAIPSARRQLAGEGAAADSILSGTDTAVGLGVEDAEDNIAGNIVTVKGAVPAVPATRRQLDKISNGAAAISNAAGTGAVTAPATNAGDSLDGSLTSTAANAGAQVAGVEESTIEGAGEAVPKSRRQLDKISNGAAAISNAAGTGAVTAPVTDAGDSIDGTSTSAAANAGAEVAGIEESTIEGAGSAVPKL